MVNRRLLKKLAAEHGTPLFVVDHDQLRRNYAAFKRHLPRVQAYYAVKANPAPEVLTLLAKLGSCFDTASVPEIEQTLAHPSDILDYFLAKTDAEKAGLMPALEKNYMEKHRSVDLTAQALVKAGIGVVCASKLHS